MKKSVSVQELENIIAMQKATIESLLKVVETLTATVNGQKNQFVFPPSIPTPAPPAPLPYYPPYIGDPTFGPFGGGTVICGDQWQATNKAPDCQIGQNQ